MNYIARRFFIVFLILGTFIWPLHGDNSAIELLKLINVHTTSSKKSSDNPLRKDKKIKPSQRKPSAIKTIYIKAKLIASKQINYVVNQKKISAKHLFYTVAGLASFLLLVHGYRYMFDFEQIEALLLKTPDIKTPHSEKENPAPLDESPCNFSIPVVQDNNELLIPQSPEKSEQLVNEKVDSLVDQQEQVHTEATDESNNLECFFDENSEELRHADEPKDIQEKEQQLINPADNSDGPSSSYLALAGGAVVVSAVIAGGILTTYAEEIASALGL